MRRPADPRGHGYAAEWIRPVPAPDADGRRRLAESGGTAQPTIMLSQLGHDHALVVVRGELCVEFLLSVRQHLTSLVDAGVRYVVMDLAEVTACPPRWSANSRQRVGRCTHGVVTALESAAVDDLFPVYRAARTEFR